VPHAPFHVELHDPTHPFPRTSGHAVNDPSASPSPRDLLNRQFRLQDDLDGSPGPAVHRTVRLDPRDAFVVARDALAGVLGRRP